MDEHMQSIFLGELQTQCEIVLIGAEHLDAALQNPNRRGTAEIWAALQEILISAANISKLLWGSAGKRERDRQALRDRISIDNSSCLHSPKLRNDFEHFDERIELWFAGSEHHAYVGRNIGPPNMIVIGDAVPTDQFGHFDPTTGLATFWTKQESILHLVREVQRIFPTVRREASGPGGWDA